ncbi:unnamed protein product [Cylicocyclus nassatus]|uniref:Uncharacterized protein n=1 Tax=Cylicocyclus nassatus TaxID=53992 RepID=A0AA36H4N9_CYLNA|nr:unnamed protein product [Cylicocyclus nassatus]
MACLAVHSHLLFILLANYACLGYFLILCDQSMLRSSVNVNFTASNDGNVRNMDSNVSAKPSPNDAIGGVKIFASAILHFMVVSCLLACIFMNNCEKCSTTLPPAIIVVVLIFSCLFNVVGIVLLFTHQTYIPHEKTALLGVTIMSLVSSVFIVMVIAYFIKVPPRLLIVIDSHEANRLSQAKSREAKSRGSKNGITKALGLFRKSV